MTCGCRSFEGKRLPPSVVLARNGTIALWGCLALYALIPATFRWLLFDVFGLDAATDLGRLLEMATIDGTRLLLTVFSVVYAASYLRGVFIWEEVLELLCGKKRFLGYAMAVMLGGAVPVALPVIVVAVTGFAAAGIPFGMTAAFLLSSMLLNEAAVVAVLTIHGLGLTALWCGIGALGAFLGGWVLDLLSVRWSGGYLPSLKFEHVSKEHVSVSTCHCVLNRYRAAWDATRAMMLKSFPWLLAGILASACARIYLPAPDPTSFLFDSLLGVPVLVAAFMVLPLDALFAVPVIDAYCARGLPIGTALVAMMASGTFGLSAIWLAQVVRGRALIAMAVYLGGMLTLVGWCLNRLT